MAHANWEGARISVLAHRAIETADEESHEQ